MVCSDVECVKALLAHSDINCNAQNEDGKTAFMLAAEKGLCKLLHVFFQCESIDVHLACCYNGFNALMIAAANGHVDAFHDILEYTSIDINYANPEGWTALMVAAKFGLHEIIPDLLSR